ncbi:hypothetical protein CDCA_CDCA17G4330 [Cyanidium caldarium]|uniref:Uncharacterized protein n=1 Tax=Cyanidium caldarium TaxID=2771 RepID=A0AAV9J1V6_CYACA|nr:hypothetical protein CDCA_CDCA17G4330 [Cyanidium caldarium]
MMGFVNGPGCPSRSTSSTRTPHPAAACSRAPNAVASLRMRCRRDLKAEKRVRNSDFARKHRKRPVRRTGFVRPTPAAAAAAATARAEQAEKDEELMRLLFPLTGPPGFFTDRMEREEQQIARMNRMRGGPGGRSFVSRGAAAARAVKPSSEIAGNNHGGDNSDNSETE